ncbi:MAG: MFS transporter [Mucilaginibacter sp.]|uniref:MFS transporter n=1 Tax=Mucilaginibacter sp. TaxID=1882438 RepID=UPI0031A9461B
MKKSIYIMALGAFGIITTEFGVIGILPSIARDLHITIERAGWLLSGFALTIAITGPFAMLATSRVNRRTTMAFVLALFVLSNLFSALANNFTMLMIARIIPAVLHPVFWSVSTVAAARQVAPEQSSRAVAVIMAGLSVATVVGVPMATYVTDLAGWRYSFVLSGIINLVAFIALLISVPSMPVSENVSLKAQLNGLKSRQLWVNLTATVLMLAGMFSSYSYLADFLEKITRMNGVQISVMLLIFGAAGIAGNWLTGILMSRNALLTTRVFLISLAMVNVLTFSFGGWFAPMTGIIALWGFIHTGGFLISNLRTTAEAPDAPELAASLMVSFGNAGVTIGTILGGLVIANWGTRDITLLSILLLGGTLVLSFVRFADAKSGSKTAVKPALAH